MSTAASTPIAEGLFEWPAARPMLLGSRCKSCGEHFFPQRTACSRCSSESLESVPLGDHGLLWSWTIQGFCPKQPYFGAEQPGAFAPYGVGYVEMPCGLKVEARLLEHRETDLHIGMPMQLVFEPLYQDAEGRQVIGYAFRKAEEGMA